MDAKLCNLFRSVTIVRIVTCGMLKWTDFSATFRNVRVVSLYEPCATEVSANSRETNHAI
jgi:hypothetical protein